MKRTIMWFDCVQDDETCTLPILPLKVGDQVVGALTSGQKLREQRPQKKGIRSIGNVANYLKFVYKITGFTKNGGVRLEGFVSTVSAKYLRKVS